MADISVRYIDAVLHDSSRSEIRFDSNTQYSNVRLLNVGSWVSGGREMATYNDAAGVFALIESIQLLDGNTVLDQLLDVYKWAAFSSLQMGPSNKDNGLDYSLNSHLTGSSKSYRSTSTGAIHLDSNSLVTNSEETTFRGWFRLSSLLNLVSQMPVLDTKLFQNLRVVINYRQNAKDSIYRDNTDDIASYSILRPTIAANVVMAPVPLPKNVAFYRMEVEKRPLDVGVVDTVKSTAFRSLAFSGHRVNNLVFQNYSSFLALSEMGNGMKDLCSVALPQELLQVTLNGQNLIPYSGIDNEQRKRAYLHYSYGDMLTPQGSQFSADFAKAIYENELETTTQKMSYFALNLGGEVVNELLVDHTRLCTDLPKDNVVLHLWGQVSMVLVIGQNDYQVVYV